MSGSLAFCGKPICVLWNAIVEHRIHSTPGKSLGRSTKVFAIDLKLKLELGYLRGTRHILPVPETVFTVIFMIYIYIKKGWWDLA